MPLPAKVQQKLQGVMVQRALDRAREAGESRVLAEVDHEEGRKFVIVRPEYVYEDEFFAFEGEVIGYAYPNGTFEHH